MNTYAASMHWSQSEPAWCGVFRIEPIGRVLLRHELVWSGISAEDAAREFTTKLRAWKIPELLYVVGQPDLWPSEKDRGQHIAETFQRCGLPMRKGNGNRIHCFSRLRSWLAPQVWRWHTAEGKSRYDYAPTLMIHSSCTRFLRLFPTLVADAKNPDDIDAGPQDFPAQAVARLAMSRPSAPWDEPPPLPVGAIGHDVNELRASLPTR